MVKTSVITGFFVVLILRIMTWIGVKCSCLKLYVFSLCLFNVDMQTKDPIADFSLHFLLPKTSMKSTIKMQGEI